MMNFLSKFLAGTPEKEVNAMVEQASDARKSMVEPESEPVMAPGEGSQPAAQQVAETAAAPIPDEALSDPAMPERPMYDASPSAGMGYSELGEFEEFEATVGEALLPGVEVADEDALVDAMRTVYDPEIPVNIYDLGLIYDTKISDDGTVDIEMSLTAPGCPVAGEMPGMVANAVTQVEGTGVVTVRLVWEPQWTMDRMSEDAKLALGMI